MRRGLVLLLVMAALAACTAAPKPPTSVEALDAATTTTVAGGNLAAPGTPTVPTVPGGAPAPTVPGAPAPSVAGQPGATGSAGQPGAPAPSGSPGGGFTSTLYEGANDTAGITDDRIVICAHAALTYAAAFNTSPDDLNVYWNVVNEAGGVHGRRVEVFYENDDYKPDVAVQAATRCKQDHNPFILIGGIGFDQIPAVRTWAENNKVLYIHHTATREGCHPRSAAIPTASLRRRSMSDTSRCGSTSAVLSSRTRSVPVAGWKARTSMTPRSP